MNRYIQITIETTDSDESDMLVARLSQSGFEGFEEEPKKLHAYIPESLYNAVQVEKIIAEIKGVADPYHTLFKTAYIEPRNWNAEWEKDFEPVVVENFCAIRAHFHPVIPGVQYDLVITPKMSFGTGHHATTFMMISIMKDLDFRNRTVLDFGTGTGVLAILARKLGADNILAIDYDEWSIVNARENIEQNNCSNIYLEQLDEIPLTQTFEIILANINLNVITSNLSSIVKTSLPGATVLLSGFLKENESILIAALEEAGLQYISTKQSGDWIVIMAKKM